MRRKRPGPWEATLLRGVGPFSANTLVMVVGRRGDGLAIRAKHPNKDGVRLTALCNIDDLRKLKKK